MSKQVKQLQMEAIKKTFGDVRDLVLVNIVGVDAIFENQMRLSLRKKSIRLQLVKNNLASRVFSEMGLASLAPELAGQNTIAWGGASVADLSKELDVWAKKNPKIKPRVALADGVLVSFEAAKKFPTRQEAISRVIGLALSPARRVAGQLRGPGARLAGQLKQIKESSPAAEEAAAGSA